MKLYLPEFPKAGNILPIKWHSDNPVAVLSDYGAFMGLGKNQSGESLPF